MVSSWFSRQDDPDYPHRCCSHGWDGPCQAYCRADDRYVTQDGRTLFLCPSHRSPRRAPCNTYVGRTERVTVTWGGGEG